ncbi:MAG: glutamate racemase [Flavobacterium sp.]
MNNLRPIGLFDSGVGGISIWKDVINLLPTEDTIYLADSKNAPYGQKSKIEIIALSCKNVELLISMGCKLIIVACNTATTNAIKELRARYDIPFIGIEPALKPAVKKSHTQVIGILATQGTLSSELFANRVAEYKDTTIIEQVGLGIVDLIESGQLESKKMTELLHEYIQPMIDRNIDYLVLGCTHYPFLIPQIKKFLPDTVTIIDSGAAVAKQTQKLLSESGGLKGGSKGIATFYSNSDISVMSDLLENAENVQFKAF